MHFNTACPDKYVTEEVCIQKQWRVSVTVFGKNVFCFPTDATICAAWKSCGCKGDFRDGPAPVYQQLQTQQAMSIGVAEEKKIFFSVLQVLY